MRAVNRKNYLLMCVWGSVYSVYYVHCTFLCCSEISETKKNLCLFSVLQLHWLLQVILPQTNLLLLIGENTCIYLWTLPSYSRFQPLRGFSLGNVNFSQVMKVVIFSSKVLLWRGADCCTMLLLILDCCYISYNGGGIKVRPRNETSYKVTLYFTRMSAGDE